MSKSKRAKEKKQTGGPNPPEQNKDIPKDKVPAILIYNAWPASLKEDCQCDACKHLKKLTPYMAIPISPEDLSSIKIKE